MWRNTLQLLKISCENFFFLFMITMRRSIWSTYLYIWLLLWTLCHQLSLVLNVLLHWRQTKRSDTSFLVPDYRYRMQQADAEKFNLKNGKNTKFVNFRKLTKNAVIITIKSNKRWNQIGTIGHIWNTAAKLNGSDFGIRLKVSYALKANRVPFGKRHMFISSQ